METNMENNIYKKVNPTVVAHHIYKNKVIVILSNGKWGISKCNIKRGDIFDLSFGTQLATARAYKDTKMEKILIGSKYGEEIPEKTTDIYKKLYREYLNQKYNDINILAGMQKYE